MKCQNCGKENANASEHSESCKANLQQQRNSKLLIIVLIVILIALVIAIVCSIFSDNKEVVVDGYVDLALPSGTMWKTENESGYYDYVTAVKSFGNHLPSKAQLKELRKYCKWTWTGQGYKVIAANGNSIDLPAEGYRNCEGNICYVDTSCYYWSYTSDVSSNAWSLAFDSTQVYIYSAFRCFGQAVRLVKD